MTHPRIYETDDGRHVLEGHPDARILVYGVGDDVPKKIRVEVGLDEAEAKPADKEVKPANKGGLTINRPARGKEAGTPNDAA